MNRRIIALPPLTAGEEQIIAPPQGKAYRVIGLAMIAMLDTSSATGFNHAEFAAVVGPRINGVVQPVIGSTVQLLRDGSNPNQYQILGGLGIPSEHPTMLPTLGGEWPINLCLAEDLIVTSDLAFMIQVRHFGSGITSDALSNVFLYVEDL